MGFFRKKDEKKKLDYSEETKDLFAERDAFYAEQRRQMGGSDTNPELANQSKPEPTTSREEDVENLLGGGGDFNPYVDSNQDSEMGAAVCLHLALQPQHLHQLMFVHHAGKSFKRNGASALHAEEK